MEYKLYSIVKMEYNDLNILDLPDESLLNIMLYTDYNNLLRLCNSNSRTRSLCEDNKFWRDKFLLDFPEIKPPFNTDINNKEADWKDLYKEIMDTNYPINIYVKSGDEITEGEINTSHLYSTSNFYLRQIIPYTTDNYIAFFLVRRSDRTTGEELSILNYVIIDDVIYKIRDEAGVDEVYIINNPDNNIIKYYKSVANDLMEIGEDKNNMVEDFLMKMYKDPITRLIARRRNSDLYKAGKTEYIRLYLKDIDVETISLLTPIFSLPIEGESILEDVNIPNYEEFDSID
ncbi:F-box domain-containing protein [Orpheovirus IHUMI-LCC2]|uniref:F-box domain-containing protein n=1 Tax=Orpheovirus IHUMI-LCC2 TaxID=2023057 RepID=A0A2I2L4C0_9VIRU|nr:F-box domain-containing protein [Orpheovirus IHUMI-LCC2]SNW62386.1 F-box domain-containing protein [Orpheovirus IHUMI-LCC2]